MARNVLILCQVGQTFQERFVIVKKNFKKRVVCLGSKLI